MIPARSGSYQEQLNIASFVTNTRALGPGNRAVIWTQGCPLHCRGCIAPSWIPFAQANLFTIEGLLSKIDIKSLDGLTLSGGEPMEQAIGLASLVKQARNIKDIDLICFTGYGYEKLVNDPPNDGVVDLLKEIDVLIDGPYVESKNNSVGLRGSTNQRILHLTPRLANFEFETQNRQLEVTVTDGELSFVGIPTVGVKTALDQAIAASNRRMESYERL